MAEARSEVTITGLRPKASESELATSIATASRPVVSDKDRLLAAAPMPNARENSGISGCTQ